MDPEAVRALVASAASALVLVACAKKPPPGEELPSASAAPPATVPPVAPPPGDPPPSADPSPSGDRSAGQTPYEQARAYFDSGQLWLARLSIERKALGGDGTKPEVELLSRICEKQGDAPCVTACARKLGKKSLDAGAARPKKGRR